jgi:hypothetical protein
MARASARITAWTVRGDGFRIAFAGFGYYMRQLFLSKGAQMKRLLVALSVLALCFAQPGLQAQGKTKTMNMNGTVKSVSGNSLVVSGADGKDMTFTVDNTTKFVGKGLGTKAKAGKLTATDAVASNDRVRVAYHDMGGTMHAATVTVTSRAAGATPKK